MSTTPLESEKNIRYVDAAVIGAGTAGQNAYRQIRKVTDNLVIINEGFWSTTCATIGCMPSKLLIAAAERAYHAQCSEEFGIEGTPVINGPQVMKRLQDERDHFASGALKTVDSWEEANKLHGRAAFSESGLIEVHTATGEILYIKAKHIIIATGSTPFVPEGWKTDLGEALITSDTVFELSDLPSSMAVVGAGAIGLELAQAMSRLGVKVALFNRNAKVGGLQDEAINKKAIACFEQELDLRLDSTIDKLSLGSDQGSTQAIIEYTDANGESKIWRGEKVLVATGRRNSLHTLGLEHIGVKLDDKNRPLNLDKLTGNIEGTAIYIVGDANAHIPLLHVASNEGYLAGKEVALKISGKFEKVTMAEVITKDPDCSSDATILNDMSPKKSHTAATPMSIIFSSPQIMNVGQSLSEIKEAGQDYVTGEVSFDNQGRSRVMGVNCGLLHIYACPKTSLILGASMVGPDAEYIAHILATAITNQVEIDGLLASPFYHPTILEGLRTALRDANDKIREHKS